MSEHVGYVVKIDKIDKHPNADRLQIAEIFGNPVIVDMNIHAGDIGIYFPVDLQLSTEYCDYNNLVRKKDENGKNIGGYLDPDKRNICAVRLRGERSDGLFMPIKSLDYTGVTNWSVGQIVDVVNGHEICRKYIPRSNAPKAPRGENKNKNTKPKFKVSPLFVEHADTEQLAYNLDQFKVGDQVEITLKMHGTSGRTGYLPVFKKEKKTLWQKLTHQSGTPIYEYDYISGTRRTVLTSFDGGYYGNDDFRKEAEDLFVGKLHKGEEVFYEIVGFTNDGRPIMPSVPNSKTNDPDFIKKYGEMTEFSYGCNPNGVVMKYGRDDIGMFSIPETVPKHDVYVYRMTMTNEDGDMVEYTPDFMRYRCEQMGVKSVPVFTAFTIPAWTHSLNMGAGEYVKKLCEYYYDGPDPVGKTHVREGVVARIINRPTFTAYKDKNWSFKCLEGIAKNDAVAPDMEEAQDLVEENN